MSLEALQNEIQELHKLVSSLSAKIDNISATKYGNPATSDPLFSHSTAVDKGTQILLMSRYHELRQKNQTDLPDIRDVGFRCFSQHDEDGIILYLFSIMGSKSRKFVELGCGDGVENNTTNLIINHHWHGGMVDGSERNIKCAIDFFKNSRDAKYCPPVLAQAWIEPDNVNRLITSLGFTGEIDFLSIDLDGVDYWTWQAIDVIDPRLVVVETPTIWGPEHAKTIPYQKGFSAKNPNFYGASLLAYIKLAKQKGYRFVASNKYGTNAFFVKNGVADDLLPELPAEAGFSHPRAQIGVKTRLPLVKDMPWVDV